VWNRSRKWKRERAGGFERRIMSGSQQRSYVGNVFAPTRRVTRPVSVGDVVIGGASPIVVQSMTNTDTMDTKATVDQIERLADADCPIVRVTAPSIRDAENLAEIVRALRARKLHVPLVADIHFTPNAAMIAAQHVEKVRVNPGNYADKKKFEVREYSEAEYAAELERVAERFRPLVQRCKQNGVAMRIGTNHGSLSDRILNRFGDTPEGMVASALEFLDVCEDEGYRDVVFSMKASNTQVAIHAYRLLAAELEARAPGEPGYPFHVGVTEAGDSEDGRIKSAIGIGSLLEDGLGDTIRVSLTEDPVKEVPVARALAERAQRRWFADAMAAEIDPRPIPVSPEDAPSAYAHVARATETKQAGGGAFGGAEPVRVEIDLGRALPYAEPVAAKVATALALQADVEAEGLAVRVVEAGEIAKLEGFRAELERLGVGLPLAVRCPVELATPLLAAFVPARLVVEVEPDSEPAAVDAAAERASAAGVLLEWCLRGERADLPKLAEETLRVSREAGEPHPVFSVDSARMTHAVRVLASALRRLDAEACPIVLRHVRLEDQSDEEALLDAAIDLGAPLCDGIGDLVSLARFGDPAKAVDASYRILQGARRRTTRTEYISCPSCGRTLFDLEETTALIKSRTEHLSGVKIAVMGCIVNGPGEMADADFGYVGSGVGQVSLYVGKQVVARAVPQAEAPDRLVELIRKSGRWQEAEGKAPPSTS
jgi:(E)-4-hydroxy-3-methylbut-2-enyl-diphosphate synthase